MIKHSAFTDQVGIFRSSQRENARSVAELLKTVTNPEVSDEELGEALVMAVNLSTFRFPFGWKEYNEVPLAAARTLPDREMVQSVLAARPGVALLYLGEVVAHTTDTEFLDQVVNFELGDIYYDGRPIRQQAFDRICTPGYAARLSVEGKGYAKVLGLSAVTDRAVVAQAITGEPLTPAQSAQLARRFINDAEFGPLIAANLLRDFKAVDTRLDGWQNRRAVPVHDPYGGEGYSSWLAAEMRGRFDALSAALDAGPSSAIVGSITFGLSDVTTTNGQQMVKQLLAPVPQVAGPALAR